MARICGFSLDDGILVFEGLTGRSLHARLMESSAASGQETELAAVARSLAALHAVRTPALPQARPGLVPAEYAAIALRHFPERERALRHALDELSDLGPAAPAEGRPVHGDLHDRNILLDGDRVALLDLDMLHAGDPADDVGNLAAHLVLRALQRGASLEAGRRQAMHVVHAYLRFGGPAAPASVSAVCARALFRLSCLYLFRRRWQGLTPLLVQEAGRWTKRDLRAMEDVA
jgi:aminoglycoside phosphotransferase (APT) family kinase protein